MGYSRDADFPVGTQGLVAALDFIAEAAAHEGLSARDAGVLGIVVDEIVGNILSHDPTVTADARFAVAIAVEPSAVALTLTDPGQAFDPIQWPPDRQQIIGGHGLNIAKGLVDSIAYERSGDRNRLTVMIERA